LGTKIKLGELRFGVEVQLHDEPSWVWRHWGCVTPQVLSNVRALIPKVAELEGYDGIGEENQAKLDKAWEDGRIADEDVPPSALK
ncbi:hypothetical protein DL93DRAFT_2028364, partial [Clavulina sp. PMI_390]